MKFNDLIAGKSLSIANLLSLSDKNLAKKMKEHEFKYISCIEDSELGGENLIRCEIGSISYVLALLCKYANLSCDEFFSELDDGLISGECNVGEEEFEEELGEWIKDVKNIVIDDSFFTHPDKDAIFWLLEILGKNVVLAGGCKKEFNDYLKLKEDVSKKRDVSLMDMATIVAKYLKKEGKLDNLEVSEENNACSVYVDVEVEDFEGKKSIEQWLLMFKNETHNHPTEIEPFGGASTCLGGAIRDPLSGRAYVYQAIRVTGSGNPLETVEETLKGKLPQKKITTGAASGYSSYGNQIGIATTLVSEIYHDGYKAKRMEVGAVVAAAPIENVVRKSPVPTDSIIIIGGKTGRDGCGGATGSSKEHNDKSLLLCEAEVQKGNAPEERKIQRLFRNPNATKLIKKCNDFGAGGVSVAIGELADGVEVNLDLVPVKYDGLNGTELAISESQERMAVIVSKEDTEKFLKYVDEENLLGTVVGYVTDKNRLTLNWKGKAIVDISRDFLNTNGVQQNIDIEVRDYENENVFEIMIIKKV